MAGKRSLPRLSAGDIELLEMLWREGEVTLAAAHQALALPIGYTTVQTRLNRLVKKRLAARSDDRPARYRATVKPADVQAKDLNLLVERVSGGSVVPLVAHLVGERSLSAAEIGELKRLIAAAEQRLRAAKRGKRP